MSRCPGETCGQHPEREQGIPAPRRKHLQPPAPKESMLLLGNLASDFFFTVFFNPVDPVYFCQKILFCTFPSGKAGALANRCEPNDRVSYDASKRPSFGFRPALRVQPVTSPRSNGDSRSLGTAGRCGRSAADARAGRQEASGYPNVTRTKKKPFLANSQSGTFSELCHSNGERREAWCFQVPVPLRAVSSVH